MKNDNKKKVDWSKYYKNNKVVPIKFNKNELTILNELFNNSSEEYLATFIKKCIFFGGSDYKEVEKKYNELEVLYKNYIDNLMRIGTNINQISMKLNFIKFINDDEKKLLFESIEELKKDIYNYKNQVKLHQERK